MAFLQHILHSLNDVTHSAGPRFIINHKIKRYGVMTELAIDPDKKLITATLQLKGEKEPIHLRLTNYTLQTAGASETITVEEIYVSREWMQAIATDMLQNRPLPLPAEAAKWLKMLL